MRIPVFLLFVGACVGHAALLVVSLNCLHGHAVPRKLIRLARRCCELLIAAGPILFWISYGGIVTAGPWHAALDAYGGFCAVLGLVAVPAVTLYRWLRRPPAALVENHTTTFDVARLLGYKPLGRGKLRHLARLPGNQIFQVDFSERVLCLPRLPRAWDGLSILHLSDLHLSGTPDRVFYQRVMDRCRAWEPDLVALTGDVIDTSRHHRWIVPVLGRLRWRIAAFAVLGNHDVRHDPALARRRLRRLNVHVLGNGWEQLEVRGETLAVIGHEGPWFLPAPDLSACPAGVFRLCLSHTPDNIVWARKQNVDLMLAGHTHGGQIRLPLVGSVLVPSRYSRRYDCGVFDEPPTVLYVSRGLAGKAPLRYHCRPEVTKIVLRTRAEPKA